MNNTPGVSSELIQVLQKNNVNGPSLAERLRSESGRFRLFSRAVDGLMLDFSRLRLGEDEFRTLIDLAKRSGVEAARRGMFAGAELNFTEGRPVLHPLWRSGNFSDLLDPDEARMLEAAAAKMKGIVDALGNGRLPGAGETAPIRHIIHIGIGGSLLGPRLLCEVFPPRGNGPEIHFLSSVDALDRETLMKRLDPAETAIMLVSKSFTTSEVLLHARRLRAWQLRSLSQAEADRRLFAVTASPAKAEAFGVPGEHILEMGEWTGGRYSVWSPVGVTAAVAMGNDGFEAFLRGGASMDRHFRETPFEDNLPVILGMISVWHRNVCGYPVRGLIPYDGRLKSLPSWLQQLEMESNGKSVDVDGEPVALETSPVVMGDTGTDAQHALFQAFHQGTGVVPLEFIGVIEPDHDDREAQQQLLSHMLAQATALAVGRDRAAVEAEMRENGVSADETARISPHRVMPGNRPSCVTLLDRLTPEILGRLLVLYEHATFVESIVWRINAFDQWGVELGKVLAGEIEPVLAGRGASVPDSIPGLEGVIDYIRRRPDRG
jgi:glucose-6-phosphate isomerase